MRDLLFCFFVLFLTHFTFAAGLSLPGASAAMHGFDSSTGIRWAVCIGVSDYNDPDLLDLPYARNDARGVAAALRDNGGFDRILIFTDDLNTNDSGYPSRKNILSELDRLVERLGHDDLFLFFFSGHGVTDSEGRSHLLPADAELQDIEGTGISLEIVQRVLDSVEPGQRLIFIDAARPEITKIGHGFGGVYPDRSLWDTASTVFYAAREGSFSHDLESSQHGVFAAALVSGMKGEADRDAAGDNDGVVSIMELGAYVDAKVTAWSLERGTLQSPHIMFDIRTASRALTRVEDPPDPSPLDFEHVSLRSRPMDLSEQGVKALLLENDFYATCWTYNGDFCNPNGEFINSFKDNGDGTVTDERTRLMWQKGASPGVMNWAEAGAHIRKLNQDRFAGYDNWRLPTLDELGSLMERSWLNDDLFLDPVFSSAQKIFWSADTRGLDRAWRSNFHLGVFLDFPMSDLSAVRAVRDLR